MQRIENGLVVISCDFTGLDWDERIPMIEGHRGAVLSLDALAKAIDDARPADAPFVCTMCLRDFPEGERVWKNAEPPPSANPSAALCWDCIRQADRAFAKDPDTPWERRIPPDARWT